MVNKSLMLCAFRKTKSLVTRPINSVGKHVSTPTAQHSMAFQSRRMNVDLWNEPWDGGCRRDVRERFCKISLHTLSCWQAGIHKEAQNASADPKSVSCLFCSVNVQKSGADCV